MCPLMVFLWQGIGEEEANFHRIMWTWSEYTQCYMKKLQTNKVRILVSLNKLLDTNDASSQKYRSPFPLRSTLQWCFVTSKNVKRPMKRMSDLTSDEQHFLSTNKIFICSGLAFLSFISHFSKYAKMCNKRLTQKCGHR